MRLFLPSLLMGGALLAVSPAFAQAAPSTIDPADDARGSGLPSAGSGTLDPGKPDTSDQQQPGDDDKNKTPAPPPSLPGSHTQPDEVAPASRTAADMNPTAALFDAIDRGDTVAARDAVNRGANLDGKNVLGLTPIELSVDLNRNDISFLLLSMRGSAAEGAPGSVSTTPVHLTRGRQTTLAKTSITAALVASPTNPSAGFLGFDHAGGS